MKIAFHLNCLEHGGAERVVVNLADRFAKDGHKVTLATEWQGAEEYVPDAHVKRVHVGLRQEDEKKGRVTKFLLRVRYLQSFLREYRPDVLLAFDHRAGYRALMACSKAEVPVILSVRTDPAKRYHHISDKIQIRWLFPRAAGCVYQTEDQRSFFWPYLQEKTRIILNPVNEKFFIAPVPIREKTVVHHGRLTECKNQSMLIRAFLRVHEKHPEYVLKIYGGDSGDGTKQRMEALIREHHAETYVLLSGDCDHPEQQLATGGLYAFTSDWEGLPNALLEAMAMGLPVIATDCPCGGPGTVIRNGENGLLIPVGDENALTQAMLRLVEDRAFAERLGTQAMGIRERVNADAIYSQWNEYIKEVVGAHKPGSMVE